jgi:hypothetical protein
MMRLKRLLAGEHGGWSQVVGTLVLLGAGLGLVLVSVADLRYAVAGPKTLGCADYLNAPQQARWVSLTGCRLELPSAAARSFKGWLPLRADSGSVGGRSLELFIPLGVLGTAPQERSPVLVSTADPALLRLVDALSQLPDEASADAFTDAHAKDLEAVLAPPLLTGYVEPVDSMGSRQARSALSLDGAVVLRQNTRPEMGKGLCTLLIGFALTFWALLPIVRRGQLWLEAGGAQPPGPGDDAQG